MQAPISSCCLHAHSHARSSWYCKLDDPVTLSSHAQCRMSVNCPHNSVSSPIHYCSTAKSHSFQLYIPTVHGCLIDVPQRAKSLVIPSTSTSCCPDSLPPDEFHHPQHPRQPFRSAGLMLLVIRVTARPLHPFCIGRPQD